MHKSNLNADSSEVETVPALAWKTILSAEIAKAADGDQRLVIHCSDGSSFTVSAWKGDGYPMCIMVSGGP
jgi:hypothetical protein